MPGTQRAYNRGYLKSSKFGYFSDTVPVLSYLPVVPHKAVAEVSKIGNL
jgi:hypothetical protein